LAAHEAAGDGVVEEVAGAGGVVAQVDAGGSDRVELGATMGLVEKDVCAAPPDAQTGDGGLGAMPEAVGGGGVLMDMRE